MGDSVKLMLHYDDADVTYDLIGKKSEGIEVGQVVQVIDKNPYHPNPMVTIKSRDEDGNFHAVPLVHYQISANQVKVVQK